MAADRQRLAAALAYEEERRRRMMESVPVIDDSAPTTEPRRSLRSDLENLSSGLGQAGVNILEGGKALLTDPIGTVKGTYETVKGVVRDPSLIADALRYTADKAMSGPLGAGEVIGEMVNPVRFRKTPVMQEIDVYHGTPHRFPATETNPLGEFDASKIGTGEGAQAFGHGIYFAENPRVAGEYQKMEANIPQSPVRMFKGQELQAGSPQYHAATLVDSMGLNKARKEVANWIATADPRMTREVEGWRQTLDTLNAASNKADFKSVAAKGSLYKADLPDEMIDRMLDWDKPLSQQPAAFQELMKMTDLTGTAGYIAKTPETTTFGELYNALTNQLPPKDVSEYFRNAGIPGIKYFDAGSRGQGGGGTRNFVVFPGEEKKVKILERNGEKLANALKTTAAQKQANVAKSEMSSLVDLFNRQAKREVDFTNQRLERTSGAGEYITFSPAQSLSDIDNDVSYAGLSSKANLLEQIGKDQGFTTKVEGSSKSGSQYVKFYKELDDGEIDFKIRISDHSDVSRFSPTYEKKALDLNPDSTESIADAIDFLKDQNKVKKFYEEF